MDILLKVLYILLSIIAAFIVINIVQIAIKLRQKYVEDLPTAADTHIAQGKEDDIQYQNVYNALCGRKIIGDHKVDEEYIYNALSRQANYINGRFDCSDFRLQLMFRIYKDCGDKLSDRAKELIKNTFLGFKYFMDEPGDDSMCFWSENHQLLFAVVEYLAGQEWENEIFTNTGMTGKEHKDKAIIRINAWIEQRFKYGFSEYLSNVYLQEDIAPMANYIEYSKERKSAENLRTILHLLWLDVALNSVKNRFVAASSRMYGNNKAGNIMGNSLLSSMNCLWGKEFLEGKLAEENISEKERKLIYEAANAPESSMSINFIAAVEKGAYALPEAIKNIALHKENLEVKMSCGNSPEEFAEKGLIGQQSHQIMAQLGSETFTNKEVFSNSFKYLKTNKMFKNKFIFYYKFLDIWAFRLINLNKLAAKLDSMTHGISIGRGNIYTYRTSHYSMTTVVKKNVDVNGAQDHVWSANIGENLALFTTHPARDDIYRSSPGYWIGNGRRPMSVQNKNVNITVYKLPEKKRLAEPRICNITHAYFPKCFYDETELRDNIIFARKGKVIVSMISNGKLEFEAYNDEVADCIFKDHPELKGTADYRIEGEFDLVRRGGNYHVYVTELSTLDDESFDEFKNRILSNKIEFYDNGVVYTSLNGSTEVNYDGVFKVNGEDSETEFKRYDCEFCKSEREADIISVCCKGEKIDLSLA